VAPAPAQTTGPLRLLPLQPAPGGWRVAWASETGATYELQRWNGTALDSFFRPLWQPVTRLRAEGPASALIEPAAPRTSTFYRIALVATPPPSPTPGRFLALDPSGRPTPDAPLAPTPGTLPPLEFLPAGAVAGRESLSVRIPQPSQWIVSEGRERLRFTEAELRLGSDSALQIDVADLLVPQPDASLTAVRTPHAPQAQPRTLTAIEGGVRITSASPLELPTGAVTAADLENLLGLQPGSGVPLRVFDRFTLRWHSGVLEDAGIRGGRFSFADLPLPVWSGDYPDFILPLTSVHEVRLPFHGRFAWPDTGRGAPELALGPADPGWLILRPDGSLGWHNRSEIRFPGGGRLRADIRLDEPIYRIAVFAESLEVPLIGNLAALILPDNPAACLDAGLDPAMLTRATGCLDALGKAYLNVAASAVAATPIPDNPEAGGPPIPPDDLDTSVSVLNAWTHRAVAAIGPALPLAPQRDLLTHAGRNAAAATDLLSAARHRAALARATAALHRGSATAAPDDLATLNAALDEATAAAILRARDPNGAASHQDLLDALTALIDTHTLLAEANRPDNPALHQAVADRLHESLETRLASLGVTPGQFNLTPLSPIASLNRFTVFQHLHELIDTLAQAQILNVHNQVSVPHPEALTQFALQLWNHLETALDQSEAAGDVPGFLFAFEDLLDLQASRQLSIFPDRPELSVIPMPNSPAFTTIVNRFESLALADLARPYPERSLVNEQSNLRRLVRFLREVPPGVTLPAAPFERAHERANTRIAAAASQPASILDPATLVSLLELGLLNDRLRRRMNLPPAADWDHQQLPTLVLRLAEIVRARNAWSEAGRALSLLLQEARLNATATANTSPDAARRRLHLEQTVAILAAARDAAVALWDAERARREFSTLDAADLLLPGEVRIDRAAGAAMGNPRAGWITGNFRGLARLPKFNGHLEILNASFDQTGAFSIAAHGSVSFRGTSLGISRRQPLVLDYRFPGPLRLHGEGTLALPNGMSFATRIHLDDPTYGFRIEARDLRFELARELTVLRPTLDATTLAAAGDDLRRAYTDYLGSMTAALEALARQTGSLPDLHTRNPGQPPAFETPQITLPFSELNAWSESVALTATQGINRSHALTVSSLRQVFQTLRDDAELAAETLETEARFLDLQQERLAALRRSTEAFALADERLLLGEIPDTRSLQDAAAEATRAEARLHLRHLAARPPQSLADYSRHTSVLLDIAASGQSVDADFSDLDNDGLPNETDNCPALWSSAPLPDADADGFGDACDPAPLDPAIPANDPCSQAVRLAGRHQLQAQALLRCQYQRELASLGFNPLTGTLDNPQTFEGLSADELDFRQVVILQLESDAQAFGLEPGSIPRIHHLLIQRLIQLRTAELAATPESNRIRRTELALAIAELRSLTDDPAVLLDTDPELLTDAALAVAEVHNDDLARLEKPLQERKRARSEAIDRRLDIAFASERDLAPDRLVRSRRRGVVGDSLVLLQSFWEGLSPANAAYRARVDQYVRFLIERARAEQIDPAFLTGRLDDAQAAARTLADVTAWVVNTLDPDEPLVDDLRLAVSDLTLRLTTIAEARNAWWLLHTHALTLDQALRDHGSRMGDALRTAFTQSFANTLLASDRLLSTLASLGDTIGAESTQLQLPGSLRVRRAFGGILYRRDTEVLTGHFGGRLEFPDLRNAFFEISQASVATDGSFQIAAATGGPLPFGRLALTSSLQLAGSLQGLQSVTGSGQLAVPLSTTTNLYAVTVAYDGTANRLSFDTQAEGLDWRLDDDFVLFNGGLGLEVSTTEPEGSLTFRGSAGLLARHTPLPASLTRSNFHLLVTNAALRLAATTNTVSVALTNGTLLLPEFFKTSLRSTNAILTNFLASPQGQTSLLHSLILTNPPPTPTLAGPAVSLSPTNPVTVTIQSQPPFVSFTGELRFRDVGFQVPGFEAIELAVCEARLVFPSNQPPVLTNVHAALQFPLPGQTNIIEVADAALSLTGLPTGTVRLRSNLDLYREGDWRFSLLGTQSPLCPAGTGFTLQPDPAFNQQLTLRFDAGAEFAIPAELLSDNTGGALAASACASLTIPANLTPFLGVDGLGLSIGHARLGGPQGITLTNLSLAFSGLTNLFAPSPSRPFLASLGGTVLVGPAGFGLSNAVLHFEGPPIPRFTVSEVSVIQPDSVFSLSQDLPINVDEGRIRFLRDNLPVPALFNLTNLVVTLSGGVALPTRANPILASRVRDLVVTFLPDGQPRFSVDGLGFTVDLTALLGDALPLNLGGEIYVSGLNHAPNYLFAGRLRGNLKGNAVEALAALDTCGLRGVCFGLAGAEVNIPIAYGFVLTGARGGISFANVSNDPCSFVDQLPIDPITGRPSGPSPCSLPEPPECPPTFTLQDLQPAQPFPITPTLHTSTPTASPTATLRTLHSPNPPAFPCPTLGECPPASVNILCMPHPDHAATDSPHANRVIYKFTSIDESLLNAIGITPDAVASLVPAFTTDPRTIALDLAHSLRGFIDLATPRAPADAPPEIRALDASIASTLDQVELAFANLLHCAIRDLPANSQDLANLLYSAIRNAAYAGVACQDLTLKLEGSVSYTGLASFANVTGGVVLSTTGSAGVIGSVNVLGIPVGKARAFVSQTDANGNPILPSICGEITAALGPLELGSLAYLNDCPDCATALFAAFANLPARLGNAYTFNIMNQALPDLADPDLNSAQHLARLDTPDRQMAFLAAMMGTPPRDPDGQVPAAFLDFIVELADAVQPRWAMCGEVQPKLFGFPLSGGGRLYAYEFYAGPNLTDDGRQGYILRDSYAFSPIQLMANYATAAFTAGLGSLFVPALDEAQASTSFLLPSPGQMLREGFTLPPPEFAARRTRDFLANAIVTFNYRLAPFGMELGRAGGRILLPSLDHHPRGPSPRIPPALRNQGLPDELQVLLAALGDKDASNAVNRLADVSWRGEGDADFAAIFTNSPFATPVSRRNLSLRDDYFPHGGFLGAGLLDLPALLASPLPTTLATSLDTNQPPATRLAALQEFISQHLLKTIRAGELAFYIPAPNPPLDRFPTSPADLVDSLRNFLPDNPLHLAEYYPSDKGFLQGWVDVPILGLPTVRSRASWEPANALVRLDAEVPTNSWFQRFIGQSRFTVQLRGNTNQSDTIASLFTPLSNQVARLDPRSPNLAASLTPITRSLPESLAAGLPKLALALSASQIRIPVPTYNPATPLTDAQTVARIRQADIEAYSPFYRLPNATGDNPLDRVRRDGGFAIRGDFNFLNGLIEVPAAEFAVSPNPNPLGLPIVTGTFTGSGLRLFGVPFSGPPNRSAPPSPSLLAQPPSPALIDFHADAQQVRLNAQGSIPGLDLGPAFQLTPISGSAIAATATFETASSSLPQGRLSLSPCELTSPLLGPASLRIHGASTDTPFTISTDGPWSASASTTATGFDLRVGNTRVLRLSRSAAAASQPFRATVSGNGLASAQLSFDNLNLGLVIQSYPDAPLGDPRRRTFTLAPDATVSLHAASDGSFEFRASVPQALSLAGTPFASLDSGFTLGITHDRMSFTGTAGGGLWTSLGGRPLRLTVSATPSGFTFNAQATLPPLRFGAFLIDDGRGEGPTVVVSHQHVALPSGLSLGITSRDAGNPSLTLDPFVITPDGAFTATARQTGDPAFQGIVFSSATHTLQRTAAGVVSYTLQGRTPARTLAGFGSITPRSGSELTGTVTIDSNGNASLLLDAAILQLPQVGLTTEALLHGAANTNAPFGFSTTQPWSAVATFTSLTADPPGSTLPEFIRLSPNPASTSLFTAVVTGNAGNITGLTATRTGNVNLEVFRNSPMARSVNNIPAGTVTLSVTNNPRRLVLVLDPPDLTYSTNIFAGGALASVNLFRLASGSLRVVVAGDPSQERSITLDTPSLTLLPGSTLEQSLANLPTLALSPDAFVVPLGATARTVQFPGLPAVRLPESPGATPPPRLTPTGFHIAVTRQFGTNYANLLSFPETTSSLSLDFTGTRLRLRFGLGVAGIRAFGIPAPFSGESTIDVTTSGTLAATFTVHSNPPESLAANLLGFQPSSTVTLSGLPSQSNPAFTLAGNFALLLAYPNPANPTQSLTYQRNLPFSISPASAFSSTITAGLPSFDLGWLRVQPGADGHITVSRNPTTGSFAVALDDWDVRLFGVDFNNQDFAISTAGVISRSLPASTFDFGSGSGLLRLVSGGPVPFNWTANTTSTAAGRILVDLPAPTSLSLPGVPGLSGALRDGLAFGSALPNIPASGTFDRTWSRALDINGLNFGSASVRLRRTTQNGPLLLSATRNNALWTGLNLAVSFESGSPGSFAATLSGSFALGGWNFGSVNFTFNPNDPAAPFHGSANITDPTGSIGLGVSVKLRSGSKPCLEFNFNGFQQQICQP
jgi:hypothetical protein